MKTRFNIIQPIIWTALLTLSACESFTEVGTPQSQLTTPAVFESINTADAAMGDIYARLREDSMVAGTLNGLSSLLSNYSDEMQYTGSSIEIMQFNNHTITPSNSLITGLWNSTYSQIYAANLMLEGLQNSTALTDNEKARLSGEALFIRGYLHFYLINIFGDVPYITTTDYVANSVTSKTPHEQVWQNIIADLTQAETLLPVEYPSQEKVRVNKAVAAAFLARIYLYREDWANAAAKATAVIDNPNYIWVDDTSQEFLRESTATIWALHPGTPGLNTKDARTFIFSSGPPSKPSLAASFVTGFESGDLRRTQWVRTVSNSSGSWYSSYKYKKPLGTASSEEYTILFRLAEQYLIRAEANAHLSNISDCQADLNKIRNRAGLSNTTASTETELLEAIAKERRFEFFTEQGHRWFDLKRTGKATEVLSPIKSGWEDTQIILPLPQSELLLNGNLLPQNPGY
ncbi:RagB/SusD family nutrient uptake outer membrane protein [Flavobacterium cupreum]|uniref:RagB/SusD family nutrient uptake outer membrane protein n=3 Tax=Flavobacterium TaxID=237 RepID=A0A940XHB9_9FLAO|nr:MULTISPECIES: RagB/SusD family nutrient uptake outer membrane protein [Flavobacterium]MBP4139784.1 RagB/SusD family nutrient uptake outer membrane protein [Flavobacterium geliluteum]RUT67774.1 RagB/SusD family nutrient uptake outer membrane protein [Flavobacterium cupreum]TCN50552.1 SusD-like starch-binding protein associating with outer membrane [Flavobacterium circumlabens]TDO68874.1 SusD-like starch-binding protein associating with outer membrane [Flavobacterium sp. P3160]TEB41800.1 RagB